jgi:ribonuclease HI
MSQIDTAGSGCLVAQPEGIIDSAAEKPQPAEKVYLFVALPVYSDFPAEFLMPIIKLARSCLLPGMKVLAGSLIQSARNQLTFDFLLSGCTHCKYMEFVGLRKTKKVEPSQRLPDRSLAVCTIYFDGGTPNNVPKWGGFGNGYGSYQLTGGEAVKLNFGKPTSNNEAEVRTLIAAAEAAKEICDPARTRLRVVGDSQIALKWAEKAWENADYRPKHGWSPGFAAAVADLYVCLQPFAEVSIEWQPRERSVEMFGH